MMNSKLAFVFPGQGSQTVGMLDSFNQNSVVQETLNQASLALGLDVNKMIHEGPAETLALTQNTQPVMLTAAIACYRAWIAAGGATPEILAGHSLGEYTAYVAAQALDFTQVLPLVSYRAKVMQEAVPVGEGSMAAIVGLSDEAVRESCSQAHQVTGRIVEAVNFNAPSQVVIAGYKDAVDKACELAKASGAKMAILLPVSSPFHSSLLKPAALQLEEYLSQVSFAVPQKTVVNNVDVSVLTDPDKIKDSLVRQAYHPVRWVEVIQWMAAQGVTHVVECGPGKVLAGMVKRIDKNIHIFGISSPETIDSVLTQINL